MSLAEKEVEKFVRNVGRSKAEWKPGHLSVVEVSPRWVWAPVLTSAAAPVLSVDTMSR